MRGLKITVPEPREHRHLLLRTCAAWSRPSARARCSRRPSRSSRWRRAPSRRSPRSGRWPGISTRRWRCRIRPWTPSTVNVLLYAADGTLIVQTSAHARRPAGRVALEVSELLDGVAPFDRLLRSWSRRRRRSTRSACCATKGPGPSRRPCRSNRRAEQPAATRPPTAPIAGHGTTRGSGASPSPVST